MKSHLTGDAVHNYEGCYFGKWEYISALCTVNDVNACVNRMFCLAANKMHKSYYQIKMYIN